MKKAQVLLALLVLARLLLPAAYAANAGDGSGGGENSDNPLELISCSPADGTADLPLDMAVTMEFSKNVVNLAVKEQNKDCFSVADSSGQPVPIVVEMGDDQVDRDARHTIVVRPAGQWPAGETLTLTVRADLSAKSGSTMAGPVTLTFTTIGDSDEPVPPSDPPSPPESAPPADPPLSSEAAPPSNPPPSPEDVSPADTSISEDSPSPEPEISPAPEASTPVEVPTPSAPPVKPIDTNPSPEAPETTPDETAPDATPQDTSASSFPVIPVLGGAVAAVLVLVYFLTRVRKNKKG